VRELEVFLQSKELEDARRGINEHQINFCNFEEHLVAAEMSGNKEAKRLWEQHITQVADMLTSSTEFFETLGEKARPYVCCGHFRNCRPVCTSYGRHHVQHRDDIAILKFTSYIVMEDYYAAQLEFQQPFFAPMSCQMTAVGAMPSALTIAQAINLCNGARTPQIGTHEIYVPPGLFSWPPRAECFTCTQPSATFMMTSSVTTDARQVCGSAKGAREDFQNGSSISIPTSGFYIGFEASCLLLMP
jgi:hypothetical protein